MIALTKLCLGEGWKASAVVLISAQSGRLATWTGPGMGWRLAATVSVAAAVGAMAQRILTAWRTRRQGSSVNEFTMLRTLIDTLPDPIYAKDLESRFLLANQAAARNMGADDSSKLLGKTDFHFFSRDLAAGFFEDEQKVLRSGKPQVNKEEVIADPDGDIRYLLTTKVPILDAAGKPVGLVGVGRNITALKLVEAELMRVQEELKFKASHDSLTSLLNRGAILEMMERERIRNSRVGGGMAVLLADVDHFKDINDTFGHPVGDDVLRELAARMLDGVRGYDLVGRYGGEEFLIVLPGCGEEQGVARANQLRETIASRPIETVRGRISTSISVGVLLTCEWKSPTLETILREVDDALYAAKAAGRNCCRLARPGGNGEADAKNRTPSLVHCVELEGRR